KVGAGLERRGHPRLVRSDRKRTPETRQSAECDFRATSRDGREAERVCARALQRRRGRLSRRCRRWQSEAESETNPGTMMKRTLILAVAVLMLFACAHHK